MFRTQVVETSGVHGIRTQGCRMDGADKSSLNYDQNAFKCQDPDMNQTFKFLVSCARKMRSRQKCKKVDESKIKENSY